MSLTSADDSSANLITNAGGSRANVEYWPVETAVFFAGG